MKKPLFVLGASCVAFLVFSFSAYAQTADSATQGFSTFARLVDAFNATIVKSVGTLLMSSAVVAFFWGIVQYIWGSRNGDAAAITKGNVFMKWSLLALFVMFSVFGIIKFFQSIVPGLGDSKITIPEINIRGSTQTGGTGGVTCDNGVVAPSRAQCPPFTCPNGTVVPSRAQCPPLNSGNNGSNGSAQTSSCVGLDEGFCKATSGCSWDAAQRACR